MCDFFVIIINCNNTDHKKAWTVPIIVQPTQDEYATCKVKHQGEHYNEQYICDIIKRYRQDIDLNAYEKYQITCPRKGTSIYKNITTKINAHKEGLPTSGGIKKNKIRRDQQANMSTS